MSYCVCDMPMPLELVPHVLPGLGFSFGVPDATRAAEDLAVKGQNLGPLEKLRRGN